MKYLRFGERARTARLEEKFTLSEPVIGLTGARFGGIAARREFARLEEEREWVEQARSGRFLLATAVRLIPRSERARYMEEFRAELLDIPRGRRLRHALSLLRGVFVLRVRHGARKQGSQREENKEIALDKAHIKRGDLSGPESTATPPYPSPLQGMRTNDYS